MSDKPEDEDLDTEGADEENETREDIKKMKASLSEIHALIDEYAEKAKEYAYIDGPTEYADWSLAMAYVSDAEAALSSIAENYYME